MEQNRGNAPSDWVGALCEVLTMENGLLFVGTVGTYEPATGEISVELRKGESTPRGIIHRTEVKVRIHALRGQSGVVLMYGAVTRNTADLWWIEVDRTIACLERRESFRLPLKGAATISGADGGLLTCELVDISLTGVGFRCRELFAEGERLLLSGLRLLEGGLDYTFRCQVQRVVDSGEKEKWRYFYGCSFYDLRSGQEARLCQDIFALQSRAINRKAGRR